MTARALAGRPTDAWLRRLFEATSRPAWLVGVGIALLGIAAFGLQELALGRFALVDRSPEILGAARVAVTHVLISAYLMTAYVYAQRTTDRSIEALQPLLDPREVDEQAGTSRGGRVALALSVPLGLLSSYLVSTRLSPGEVSFDPTTWGPETGWHRILGLVMGILTIRLSTLLALESGRLSRLAQGIRDLDLLATDAIAPFARQGLTHALLVIGVVSAFALFLVDLEYLAIVGVVLVGTLVVAVLALLLPLRGIRARIVEAKRRELAWCHDRMRARRAQLTAGEGTGSTGLDELVAWEARILAVREWPLDASTFTRFVLYLLLPLGSWAGGALVERGIDALLD